MESPLSSSNSSQSFSIPPTVLEYCKKYFAWIEGEYTALTIINENTLCTFAHGRESWEIGKVIRVTLSDRRKVNATVARIDRKLDVIWLRTEEKVCDAAPDSNLLSEGVTYFVIGCSGRQLQEPFALSEGILCSSRLTKHGHILGTSGSAPGDSGAPVFWKSIGFLVGMVVGAEMAPVINQPVPHVSQRPRAIIVPISSLLLNAPE